MSCILKYLNNTTSDENCNINISNRQVAFCNVYPKKYFQQVVLVNKDDVSELLINSSEYNHSIKFKLKEGKKGFKFIGADNGSVFYGSSSKSTSDGKPQYSHKVQLSITGVSEESKSILKELDYANYFAALQLIDGTVEVFGFTYGLTTDNYDYDIQNNDGGSIINLVSNDKLLEDEAPYIYKSSLAGRESLDFENDFEDNRHVFFEDFNDDFNQDF